MTSEDLNVYYNYRLSSLPTKIETLRKTKSNAPWRYYMDLGFNEPQQQPSKIMQQTVETTEFFLAAFLHSKEIPLVGHTRDNKRSTFTFSGESVNELIQEFYSENAVTDVSSFTASIRQLKNLMYGGTTIQPDNDNERNRTT